MKLEKPHFGPIFRRLPSFMSISFGSGAMTIFVYKELTRNPETGNTPV